MKHTRLFFLILLIPLDYLALLLAAFLTYFIRFESMTEFLPVIYEIPFRDYFETALVVAAGWIILFAAGGLYTIRRRRLTDELAKIIFGCATGFVAIMIYLVFRQELFSSRFILLGTFALAIIFVSLGRLLLRGLERLALADGFGVSDLMLLGEPETRAALREEFKNKPSLGFRVRAEYTQMNRETLAAAKTLRLKGQLDGLVLTDPSVSRQTALAAIDCAEDLHLRFFYSADLFAAASSNMEIHTLAGLPLMEIKKTKLEGWGRITKRTLDIIGSLLLLILASPLLLLAASLVAIETGRPIIFKNERLGAQGKKFKALKFRTMNQKFCIGQEFPDHLHALKYEKQLIKEHSEKKVGVYKIKDDPRITPAGKFLRRWSLDELPQLWNILWGEMSLVGPRPHQPREVDQSTHYHRHVLAIRPGLTGLAQISGRSDLSFEEEVRLDTYYVENWSLVLDIFILLKTPLAVFLKKGAY